VRTDPILPRGDKFGFERERHGRGGDRVPPFFGSLADVAQAFSWVRAKSTGWKPIGRVRLEA